MQCVTNAPNSFPTTQFQHSPYFLLKLFRIISLALAFTPFPGIIPSRNALSATSNAVRIISSVTSSAKMRRVDVCDIVRFLDFLLLFFLSLVQKNNGLVSGRCFSPCPAFVRFTFFICFPARVRDEDVKRKSFVQKVSEHCLVSIPSNWNIHTQPDHHTKTSKTKNNISTDCSLKETGLLAPNFRMNNHNNKLGLYKDFVEQDENSDVSTKRN